jgi:hypothetical protein
MGTFTGQRGTKGRRDHRSLELQLLHIGEAGRNLESQAKATQGRTPRHGIVCVGEQVYHDRNSQQPLKIETHHSH